MSTDWTQWAWRSRRRTGRSAADQ